MCYVPGISWLKLYNENIFFNYIYVSFNLEENKRNKCEILLIFLNYSNSSLLRGLAFQALDQ